MNKQKIYKISIILALTIFIMSPVSVSAETKAGIKPGSFFYFFDTAFEKINLFFTFNPENKAQKNLEYADERLAEAETAANEKNTDAVKTAVAGYENNIASAAEESSQIKDKGKTEELLNSIADNTSKHQEVLAEVYNKVPNEAKSAIEKAIEVSTKNHENVLKEIETLKSQKSSQSTQPKIIEKVVEKIAEVPPATPQKSATKLSNSEIIEKVKSAVVYIQTSDGSGSGMIIESNGYVLTNAHVVSGVNTAKIKLSDGRLFIGSVIGRDEKIDLTLLKINGENFPTVILGDSSVDTLKQGDEVFAFGYPFGLEGDVSFKEGTISRRQIYEGTTYLETSAQIHPGNSGGPLVNRYAQVVGVNTQSVGTGVSGVLVGETIKFALPINLARGLIPDLKSGRNVIIPKVATPVSPFTPNQEDSNLKIAKCEAIKQSSYNEAILKLNQGTEARLKEIFDSLNQQYKDAINKLFQKTNENVTRIQNDPVISPSDKLQLIQQYHNDENYEAERLYQNQQTFWENQKKTVENSKQQAINQLNQLLSGEYYKCLNQ